VHVELLARKKAGSLKHDGRVRYVGRTCRVDASKAACRRQANPSLGDVCKKKDSSPLFFMYTTYSTSSLSPAFLIIHAGLAPNAHTWPFCYPRIFDTHFVNENILDSCEDMRRYVSSPERSHYDYDSPAFDGLVGLRLQQEYSRHA
jgi:hypothetical protein